MIEAAFDTAGRLFGLSFHERARRAGLASRRAGLGGHAARAARHVGLFFGDYFARPSKRSGAWMTTLRDQEKLAGDIRPIVVNVMNFAKAGGGEPTLLSFDDARTLFHEFGHGLHGLLSDVTYPMIAGTRVATDFVELPSQLYEHWLEQPEVLRRFARHYRDRRADAGGRCSSALLAARTFNQGFATVEYLASALVDLEFHLQAPSADRNRSTRPPSRPTCSRRSACPARSSCATARRISSTSSPATAMPPATTATCGRRCSTPTPSRPSRRPATCSIRRPRRGCATTSSPPAARAIPAEAYTAFRGRLPTPDALLRKRGFAEPATAE